MAKNKYTVAFDNFWSAYPRKTAKLPAFKAWVKNGIEGDAFLPKQIIQDLEKRTRLKWWPRDHSKVPHAATWINQARWEDEGWEDEIKTRTDGTRNSGVFIPRAPVEDTGPQLSGWPKMLNRLMFNYLMMHKGVSTAILKSMIATKNEVYKEMAAAAVEEIDSSSDKQAARAEMAFLFADTMLSRFDNITGFGFKERVIDMSLRAP